MTTKNRYLLLLFIVALANLPLWFNTGCANRGLGPQGGPMDTVPPMIVKRSIPQGARNVTAKNQVILFDEFIQIDGSTENILISPPQQRPPEIKAVGKKLEISFQEDLQDSTTYTIDFGNQLVDNNEKNPYKNFSICFSTGSNLDSLEIYGNLINAEDLNPMSGIVVGIHAIHDDSVVYNRPFTRIARTNEQGEFAIRNVKQGSYRLFALQDQSRDYCYQPGEALAFCDTLVTPYITTETFLDTIYLKDTLSADSLPIPDSVITREYFYYEPSNLLLRLYKEDYQRLYFQRAFRNEAHMIQLNFSGSQPAIPQFTALHHNNDSLGIDSTWVDFTQHSIITHSVNMDTFYIWLSDSMAIQMDTIYFAMTYTKSDSLLRPVSQTDTIFSVYRMQKLNERTRKSLAEKRLKMGLLIKSNGTSKFNFFDTLRLISPTPLLDYCIDSIHLTTKEDTVVKQVPFRIEPVKDNLFCLNVIAPLKSNSSYILRVDSGTMHDIYHLSNNKLEYKIAVRSDEEYATITIHLNPYHEQAYIQLLNSKDQPVRTVKAKEKGTELKYLDAGTYYMRIFIDSNNDGKWTSGEYKTHRQPEEVYYFPKKLNLKANWTFEQHFDWQTIPVLEQKPADIRIDGSQKK